MNRRQFCGVAATILATSLQGIAAVRTANEQDVLAMNFSMQISEKQREMLITALSDMGIKAILVCGVESHVIGKDKTYFDYRNYDRGHVIADGTVMQRVIWCETSAGLVCQRDERDPLRTKVTKFNNVKFIDHSGLPQIGDAYPVDNV